MIVNKGAFLKEFLFSRRNQLIVYILIIFIAPFIMCKYYLQPTIAKISELSFHLDGFEIKTIPAISGVLLLIILCLIIKRINLFQILSMLFILLIIAIGQYVSDFYMGNPFYDIQSNWHYVAYTIFSYLMYRYLSYSKIVPAKIILYTYITAMLISTADEFFQLSMTNRVFDPGDIAKDILGAVIGLILIFFVIENGKMIQNGWNFRQKKFSGYFKNPSSLLLLELILTIIFLCFSSVLTEKNVRINAVFISVAVFGIVSLLFHFFKYKVVKFILLFLVICQLVSFGIFCRKNIIYNSQSLTIYKGIPIPYFDVMFFENGFFRLVDKKTFFQLPDLVRIKSYTNDILLLGSGETGKGGGGLAKKEEMQFIVNEVKQKPLQVLILKNKEAFLMFNKLKEQNKRVVFILHHE